ncbi:MAG: ATP-binding cassette domain-containing protein [Bryobacteraceae bacterium]|nr:ATP-binding cassette domain-containing protein [Bryobacteraceae bacterium]
MLNSHFRRLLRFVRPYWSPLLLSVVLMAIAGAAHAMMAVLIVPIFDRVLDPSSADVDVELFRSPFSGQPVFLQQLAPGWFHNVFTIVAFAIISVFLIRGICDYLGNYLVSWVGINAVTDIRQTVFNKLLRHDAHFFESNSTGRIMSSVMSNIDKIQVAISSMLADWLRQSFSVVALLYVVMQRDWKLALVSLTVLPIVLVPTVRLGRRIRNITRGAQDHTADINEILQEAIVGQQVVKSFGTENFESERFRKAAWRLRNSNLRYVSQQAIASPLIEFFAALTIVGLLWYARTQIKAEQLTPGQFTSFVIALLMLYEPVKRLTGIHNIFQQAMGASHSVFEYLDEPVLIADALDACHLNGFSDSIIFDNVSFRYPTSAKGHALINVNLEVRAGEVVALVGPSGAGKTTLANLVPRLQDVTTGAIRVDGLDLRQITLSSLRTQIGIVAQDTFLFNTTVAGNIGYGRPTATTDQIREAARNAMAEEFILALPQGFDTAIGERGTRLSGGQRQRIAIARALLRDAPILILDEATSHLDTESEVLVQRALANLIQNRTVIVIAHRLSTIRRADKIVVLDAGRITEIGTHEDLVNGGGIYQRLHELQFVDPEPLVNQ